MDQDEFTTRAAKFILNNFSTISMDLNPNFYETPIEFFWIDFLDDLLNLIPQQFLGLSLTPYSLILV